MPSQVGCALCIQITYLVKMGIYLVKMVVDVGIKKGYYDNTYLLIMILNIDYF